MLDRRHTVLAAIMLLTLAASLRAQDTQQKPTGTNEFQTSQVIGSASDNGIRFFCPGELLELRLQVVGPAGDVVFDSGFKPGNVVDWSRPENNRQRLGDGTYLCLVTVRDQAGRLVKKDAIALLRDQRVVVREVEASLLSAGQVQAAGERLAEDTVNILDFGAAAATAVLAHDGSNTNLVSGSGGFSIGGGDFFANKVLEHLRITAEGNVGIGTPSPQARLDVDGLIRASRGIVYPDGTIQLSAASKTLGARSLRADQASKNGLRPGQENFEPQASGTGTQNHLARWTDNAGTLGDSGIVEVSGNIGIGTTNPQTGLDYHNAQAPFFARDFPNNPGNAVAALQLGLSNAGSRNVNVGPSFLFFGENSAGAKSFLGRVSGVWENPASGAEAGAIFFQVRANSSDTNALTERMRITAAGNVGIGTGTPTTRLEVTGDVRSSGIGGRFTALNPNNQNALVHYDWFNDGSNDWPRIRYGGNGEGAANGFLIQGPSNITKLAILNSGNIGVGTTDPNSKLEIVGTGSQMRFSQSSIGDAGGFLVSTGVSDGTLSGGAKWNGSAWSVPNITQASSASMINGEIKFFTDRNLAQNSTFTPTERMRITSTGSVGIGTGGGPQNPLDVLGIGTISGGVPGFPAVVAHFRQATATEAAAVSIDASSGQSSILYLAKQGSPEWSIRNDPDANGDNIFKIRSHNSDATSDTRLTIVSNGDVGIGVTTPTNRLHVAESINHDADPANHVAQIENTSTGDFATVLALKVGRHSNPTVFNNFITFYNGDNDNAGSIQGNDDGGIEFGGPGADYAEWLPRLDPSEKIQAGEIVGLFGGYISKNTGGATRVMTKSTGPIVAGNDPGDKVRGDYERVAFLGQVPVRVRGAVQAGDFIIASGLNDGTAVAVSPVCITSEQFDQVVGQAWASSSDPGVKLVRTAVGLIQRDPTVKRLLDQNRHLAAQIAAMDTRLTTIESGLKRIPVARCFSVGSKSTVSSRNLKARDLSRKKKSTGAVANATSPKLVSPE